MDTGTPVQYMQFSKNTFKITIKLNQHLSEKQNKKKNILNFTNVALTAELSLQDLVIAFDCGIHYNATDVS